MKNDLLKQYVSLRDSLAREKATLEARLAEICLALGNGSSPAPAAAPATAASSAAPASSAIRRRGRPPGRRPSAAAAPAAPVARRGRKRAKNSVSLKDAVLQAISKDRLDRKQILAAVQKSGYVFAAKNPLNSLSTLLYTDKAFKNYGGKFGPA